MERNGQNYTVIHVKKVASVKIIPDQTSPKS